MTALVWIAQMYGQPMGTVAQLLGVRLTEAYRITRRWRDAGMLARSGVRPVPGPAWVYPTRAAAEALLETQVRCWVPTPKMANHHTMVGRVRLALTGPDLARWVSERQIRIAQGAVKPGERRKHVHDGRYLDDMGKRWAVEVELTAKGRAAAKLAVTGAYDTAREAGLDGVVYYTADDAVARTVREASKSIPDLGQPGGLKFFVVDLRKLLAPAPVPAEPIDETDHGATGSRAS